MYDFILVLYSNLRGRCNQYNLLVSSTTNPNKNVVSLASIVLLSLHDTASNLQTGLLILTQKVDKALALAIVKVRSGLLACSECWRRPRLYQLQSWWCPEPFEWPRCAADTGRRRHAPPCYKVHTYNVIITMITCVWYCTKTVDFIQLKHICSICK